MDVLPIAATSIGIIVGLGGTAGFFAKSKGDSIIAYQSTELGLRDETIKRLEGEKAALLTEQAASKASAERLKIEADRLAGLAQGNPQLEALTKAITSQSKTQAKALKALTNAVNGMLESKEK